MNVVNFRNVKKKIKKSFVLGTSTLAILMQVNPVAAGQGGLGLVHNDQFQRDPSLYQQPPQSSYPQGSYQQQSQEGQQQPLVRPELKQEIDRLREEYKKIDEEMKATHGGTSLQALTDEEFQYTLEYLNQLKKAVEIAKERLQSVQRAARNDELQRQPWPDQQKSQEDQQPSVRPQNQVDTQPPVRPELKEAIDGLRKEYETTREEIIKAHGNTNLPVLEAFEYTPIYRSRLQRSVDKAKEILASVKGQQNQEVQQPSVRPENQEDQRPLEQNTRPHFITLKEALDKAEFSVKAQQPPVRPKNPQEKRCKDVNVTRRDEDIDHLPHPHTFCEGEDWEDFKKEALSGIPGRASVEDLKSSPGKISFWGEITWDDLQKINEITYTIKRYGRGGYRHRY